MEIRKIIRGTVLSLLLGSAVVGGTWAAPPPGSPAYERSARWNSDNDQQRGNQGRRNNDRRGEDDRDEGRRGGRHNGQGSGQSYLRTVTGTGIVRNLNRRAGTFRLQSDRGGSYTVYVTRSTQLLSRGRSASWNDVRNGGRVRIEGVLGTRNNTIQARVLQGFGY